MSKNRAIVFLSIIAVLMILGIVFAFVPVQIGTTDYITYPQGIKLGLDLKGGISAVFEADRENEDGEVIPDAEFNAAMDGTVRSLERLLFSNGYTEAQVSYSGNLIRVEVPDVDDPDTVFELIGDPAKLEFKATAEGDVLLNGKDHVESAGVITDPNGGTGYAVSIKFNSAGTKKFAEVTKQYLNKELGIYVNGSMLINPTIQNEITNGQAVISQDNGGYSYEAAYELAVSIQAGSFALNLKVNEYESVSPTLGTNAINTALIAGGVGLLLIIIVMLWWYRGLGLAAAVSIIFYTMTFLFFMAIFPWVQLSLSGIAGVLLSIGMAVDANVIIFERIKEERRLNKPLVSCVNIGFKKSMSAIIDGNVTTIIGAAVMWIFGEVFGVSAIKSFAITLFIGIILSLIFALVVTRFLIKFCFLPLNSSSDKFYGLKAGPKKKKTKKAENLLGGKA